ncbi:hypothetical protein BSM4216_0254 [Bacillus smithii]|nr:hypothetical protein BSM4216_0254 [Bacillus smithii]
MKWDELNLLFHSPSPFSCNKKKIDRTIIKTGSYIQKFNDR